MPRPQMRADGHEVATFQAKANLDPLNRRPLTCINSLDSREIIQRRQERHNVLAVTTLNTRGGFVNS